MFNKNHIYNIKINHDAVLKIMINKVNSKIPTSFIRKGDGENIIIGYRYIKGIRLRK